MQLVPTSQRNAARAAIWQATPRTDSLAREDVALLRHQGHLCPLPLSSAPVYWDFDPALRLYPVPDALFLGDKTEQASEDRDGCHVASPGAFAADGSFVVYRPHARRSERCSVGG